MKIWLAEVTVTASDSGYCLRWFATESDARTWANDCASDESPDVREIDVPIGDVSKFVDWMNEQAAV